MKLRYSGTCRRCGTVQLAGAMAEYDRATQQITCLSCLGRPAPHPGPETISAYTPQPLSGQAGASARREHKRRKNRHEQQTRRAHPHVGGLILALTKDPQNVKAWATGAEGEERLGQYLDQYAGPSLKVLHDRRIPGSRANLDHLAVTPSGVYVIDAKHYAGQVQVRDRKLFVGKRNCSSLIAAMHTQTRILRANLQAAGIGVPVAGVLCFVDARWPLLRTGITLEGVSVYWPRRTVRDLRRSGFLAEEDIAHTHAVLGQIFPAA